MDRRLIPRRNNCSFYLICLPAERPHAVLPHVSMGYSPPKGRSPTCYSPVRHSHESPKALTPVRLACLIRAASVRSEPGSNSPLYCVASHSEEQEAHFSSYSLFFNSSFARFKLTLSRSLPLLLSSLPYCQKNTHPTHRLLCRAPHLPRGSAFSAFQRSYSIRPSDFPHQKRIVHRSGHTKCCLFWGTRANILQQFLSCQVQMGNCV